MPALDVRQIKMKAYIITTILLLIAFNSSFASGYRTWTEAVTGRTLEAKITDKKFDNSSAKLFTKKGKSMWIEVKKFIPKDQEYIKKWVKPIDHLTVRVVGTKKGQKKLKVEAVSGSQAMKVVYYRPGRKRNIVKHLKVGESLTIEYWTSRKYWVRAYNGKTLVEEETDKRKTGL